MHRLRTCTTSCVGLPLTAGSVSPQHITTLEAQLQHTLNKIYYQKKALLSMQRPEGGLLTRMYASVSGQESAYAAAEVAAASP